MRALSLFTGYAGLDWAAHAVTGCEFVGHCENDPAASKVLAARYPGVPNLGDITTVDWRAVRDEYGPADVVTGGFPCQDISYAGKGGGIDTRTIPAGVMACGCPWADHDMALCEAASPSGVVPARVMPVGDLDDLDSADAAGLAAARTAVGELNARDRAEWDGPPPRRMIQENRSGLWAAMVEAVRVLRPRLVLAENVAAIVTRRPGLDVVLADLAGIGFDARWTCVRASDVGACHRRDRWFAVAYPSGDEPERQRVGGDVGSASAGDEGAGRQRQRVRDTVSDRRAVAADADGAGPQGHRRPDQRAGELAVAESHRPAAVDTDGAGCETREGVDLRTGTGWPHRRRPVGGGDGTAWGEFAAAVHRWEHVLGRPAPPPTDPAGRLSPDFVEWMQGCPAGWTDVPDVSRSARLRMLGNGVVPHQAAHAYRLLSVPELAARQAAA